MKIRGRVGLLGGTFNPIHLGHLRAAEETAEALGLDTVLFLPAGLPPHKKPAPLAPFAHRLEMARLATAANPRFEVLDLEAGDTPSYTVRTLTRLTALAEPGWEPFFILGQEAFMEISTWRDYRRLFELTGFAVLGRPAHRPDQVLSLLQTQVSPTYAPQGAPGWFSAPGLGPVACLAVTRLEISSTLIRRLAGAGRSARYLTPADIHDYILAKGLYRS